MPRNGSKPRLAHQSTRLIAVTLGVVVLGVAAPRASANTLEVIYSGLLTSGSATMTYQNIIGGTLQTITNTQSLVGDSAQITLTFDTGASGATYTTGPGSSSLTTFNGIGVPATTLTVNVTGGPSFQAYPFGATSSYSATIGNATQSYSSFFNNFPFAATYGFNGSVSDPAINGQITQSLIIANTALQAAFSAPSGECTEFCSSYDVSGEMTFGTYQVIDTSVTPIPAALPLFATGLGLIALFGRRGRGARQPAP